MRVSKSTYLAEGALADHLDCSEVLQAKFRPTKPKKRGFILPKLLQLAQLSIIRCLRIRLQLLLQLNPPAAS